MDAEPIRMRGVIEGGYVFVTDDIPLPSRCKVLVQIVPAALGPDELRTPAEMTPEEIADLEAFYSEMYGHPFKLTDADAA